MKTNAAFIWAEGAVEFDSETAVYAEIALVILPGDAENKLSFRLNNSLEYICFNIFGVLFK